MDAIWGIRANPRHRTRYRVLAYTSRLLGVEPVTWSRVLDEGLCSLEHEMRERVASVGMTWAECERMALKDWDMRSRRGPHPTREAKRSRGGGDDEAGGMTWSGASAPIIDE